MNEIVRYLAVGVLNTLFGYGCFSVLLYLGLHYSVASLLATVLGVLFNFKSFGQLVFNSRDNSRFVRFVGVYLLAYLVNVAALALLTRMGLNAYAAGAVLLLPMAALTYILHKRFVFHHA
ncbi:GtrA family protein [Pseudoduganella sp. OTU4001]|uniref:GtrA family protein n=1 Tax=Pseudoduganella sp. OTU4001 TaxID=3043854 RepID=UPI00313EFFAE